MFSKSSTLVILSVAQGLAIAKTNAGRASHKDAFEVMWRVDECHEKLKPFLDQDARLLEQEISRAIDSNSKAIEPIRGRA